LTEDEREAYEDGLLTWEKAKKWRFWVRKEWTWYYVAFVLLVVVVALMAIFHHQVSDSTPRGIPKRFAPLCRCLQACQTRLRSNGHTLTGQIINWLTPFTRKLQAIKVGWLIPVAILL
jgi:hypothetical protein